MPAPEALRVGKGPASTLPPAGAACTDSLMRTTSLLLLPLLLLALPWNSCTRGKAHLSDNGPSHLRNGAGFFNPKAEARAASSAKKAFDK